MFIELIAIAKSFANEKDFFLNFKDLKYCHKCIQAIQDSPSTVSLHMASLHKKDQGDKVEAICI
jgi:hypothetical protein